MMPTRLPSWSATSRAGRLLLAVAGVLAVLATGAFTVALRTPPTRLTHTVHAEAPSTAMLDAAGCPPSARCTLRAELPAHIRAAIRRGFPAVSLLWQSSTVDADTGAVYLAQVAATLGREASLLVTAQCVPGSTARDDEQSHTAADQHSDLAGNEVTDFSLRQQQVPGAPGCRLDVVLAAPGEGAEYSDGLALLVHDPGAQLRS